MKLTKSSQEALNGYLKNGFQIIGYGKNLPRQIYPDIYIIRKFENLFQTQKIDPRGTVAPNDINFFQTIKQAEQHARADALFFEKKG